MDFAPGLRCQIVSVHHRCFLKDLGRIVVVVGVVGESVIAHDDRPITYRTNRNGRRVVDSDPRCVQTFYGKDQLRPLPYGSLSAF